MFAEIGFIFILYKVEKVVKGNEEFFKYL